MERKGNCYLELVTATPNTNGSTPVQMNLNFEIYSHNILLTYILHCSRVLRCEVVMFQQVDISTVTEKGNCVSAMKYMRHPGAHTA